MCRGKHLRAALTLTLVMFLLLGMAYPIFVAVVSDNSFLKYQAEGSLISSNGTIIASAFIGENFTSPYYFWPRLSSVDYNSSQGSGGSQYGIYTMEFYNQTKNYTMYLLRTGYVPAGTRVPANGVEPSASGFDPDISVNFALFQIPRISHFTHLSPLLLRNLVSRYTVEPVLDFIGNPYVNVVLLDISLHSLLVRDGIIA